LCSLVFGRWGQMSRCFDKHCLSRTRTWSQVADHVNDEFAIEMWLTLPLLSHYYLTGGYHKVEIVLIRLETCVAFVVAVIELIARSSSRHTTSTLEVHQTIINITFDQHLLLSSPDGSWCLIISSQPLTLFPKNDAIKLVRSSSIPCQYLANTLSIFKGLLLPFTKSERDMFRIIYSRFLAVSSWQASLLGHT
jgi:hypothetical protein